MADTAVRTLKAVITGSSAGAVKAFHEASLAADDASKKIGDSVDGATTRVGGLFSKLGGMAGSLGLPFSESIGKLGEKFGDADTKGKSAFQSLSSVGGAALAGIGGAAIAAGVEGVRLAESFDTATSQIAAKAGISQDAAKKIGAAFLSTAGTTTFSGQEIATAYAKVAGQLGMTQGKALSSSQALDVMHASMDLAEGSGESLATSTAGLSQVMQAFGIHADGAGKAADQIYNVARATNQPVQGLAAVMARLGGRLGALAPQLSDVGTLMMFPQIAAQGSRGAMVVNTALTTLLGGSKNVKTELDSLGVHIFNASGKFVGMKSVIQQLHPALAGMSQEQQMVAEKTLFGSSAAQLMSSVIGGGTAAYDKASTAVNKLGTAHDAAEKATDNLHGQMEKLKSAGEDLATKFGEILIPKIELAAKAVEKAISWFEKHRNVAKALAAVIGGVLAVAIAAFAVNMGVKLVKSVSSAVSSISKFATEGVPKFLRGMGLMGAAEEEQAATAEETGEASSAAFGPIGLAVMGIIVVATLLITHWRQVHAVLSAVWNRIREAAEAVWGAVRRVFEVFIGFVKTWGLRIVEILLVPFTGGMSLILPLVIQHWSAIESFFTSIPGRVLNALASFGSTLEHIATQAFDSFANAITTGWNNEVAFWTGLPGKIVTALGDATSWLLTVGKDAVQGLVNGITGAASDIGKALLGAVKSGWDAVKGAINSIPVIGGALSAIGLATGGLVTKPTLALVGEAGPELVMPLDKLQSGYSSGIIPMGSGGAAPQAAAAAASISSAPVINITGYNLADPQQTGSEIAWHLRTATAA